MLGETAVLYDVGGGVGEESDDGYRWRTPWRVACDRPIFVFGWREEGREREMKRDKKR